MAKLLQKRKMGRASYKVCTLFQLLEKEGKDKIYAVIYITALILWAYSIWYQVKHLSHENIKSSNKNLTFITENLLTIDKRRN